MLLVISHIPSSRNLGLTIGTRVQVWLNGAKAKTATEIKLYSLTDVQRASNVIEVLIAVKLQRSLMGIQN